MTRTIELPLWLLVLILAFAAVTFASHFLFPSVRWFFRKRLQKAVAKLNERLERPIEPFKLARRYDMVQRLSYDPEVAKAIAEHAAEEGIPEQVAFEKAQGYAREIVPRFSATAYFGFGIRIAKLLSRAFYRVRLGAFDEARLKEISADATVVFVMNHRSNMDYVLVTWLAAERSHLSYAVGEWARVWPLRTLIRSMGAYFIRRRSRNALYRKVLSRYVRMATDGGVTQAMFPEGGLSLNGEVGAPKMGLLSYIMDDFDPAKNRDVVFIPVAMNYDRVLEDRVLVAADIKGSRKFGLRLKYVLRHVGQHVWQRITGRFHRFGYASVSFGTPMSLSSYLKEHDENVLEGLAHELMGRIRDVVPVLPVPVVAAVMLEKDSHTREEITDRFQTLVADMEARGAHIHLPRNDLDYAVEVGIRLLMLRGLIRETGGAYQINPPDRAVLAFYANSIAHLSEAITPVHISDLSPADVADAGVL
ncbi:1-acyl-sn-glycerol-3-phosphate acyltransferase [Aliiroseovarius lamellibrachiae]|mgnify:CR=1 FL=1|uniref:1-acyl-sn-glycerol-3-phosphate acyltransferase n=1 Tax=Aliiroseovarius lamellibrachiae TaxID=1924933 RepID=UPI001BDFE0EA|nr:1-acyl-sn-glycerol-3-phosphate acyltransferase [Aliiroseovarius lamellibrachiae]MBT2130454.1 1-acyl-sn-glycerol-3-phosphate acyltransferase [Aliiroseovarius lamellibrachiae]